MTNKKVKIELEEVIQVCIDKLSEYDRINNCPKCCWVSGFLYDFLHRDLQVASEFITERESEVKEE